MMELVKGASQGNLQQDEYYKLGPKLWVPDYNIFFAFPRPALSAQTTGSGNTLLFFGLATVLSQYLLPTSALFVIIKLLSHTSDFLH